MVPGMGHCGGGNGASTFDMVAALDAWVRRGTAPEQIPASRVRDGKVDRTRPLCAYPRYARYSGSGNVDDAANFVWPCRNVRAALARRGPVGAGEPALSRGQATAGARAAT